MSILKVDNSRLQLPPNWMSRQIGGGGGIASEAEVRKSLGDAVPRLADLARLSPQLLAMFGKGGVLERIRKKLATLSRKSGRRILAAHNTVAAVDADDDLYVGVEFLQACAGNEDIIAGIMAHEWGHMTSDLPRDADWSEFSWDELFEMRRDEEASADAYAGRALYKMAYDVEPLVGFLSQLDRNRKNAERIKSLKYYSVETRAAILREAYAAERRLAHSARKLFTNAVYQHPSASQLIIVG